MTMFRFLPPCAALGRAKSRIRLGSLALATTLAACSDLPLSTGGVDGHGAATASGAAGPSYVVGAALYVDPVSNARRQADAWRATRPEDAAQMEKIAAQPQATWFGDWNTRPAAEVAAAVAAAVAQGALPTLVLYNIPHRDCGLYSRGGAPTGRAYLGWIAEVIRGIGSHRAVVVLEPDAVAAADCLSDADRRERFRLLAEAVRRLEAAGDLAVYLDAGTARWHPAGLMAERLREAGIERADGFTLNVSNFVATDETIRYGEALSARIGGKRFLVDTSRNGLGPAHDGNWCNPEGRALGARPTTRTGHPLVDAFLWIKRPGESDGECHGGPAAGRWWAEYALGLARRSAP